MKLLLMLNGPEGFQTGIEDGFCQLKKDGYIDSLDWFYYTNNFAKEGHQKTYRRIIDIASTFKPDLIIFFHLGNSDIEDSFFNELRSIKSKPKIIYDEGDMYGGIAKPLNKNLNCIIRNSDIVSIRGLGNWKKTISKINTKLIYTPHHADLYRYDAPPYILKSRKHKIIFVGNRIKPKYFSTFRRMSGALQREKFVKFMGEKFPNDFALFGDGWDKFIGNNGVLPFQEQLEVYKNTWITVSYEHYPEIPYYFSNRLPIALLAGSLYVCHYHEGYEKIFNEGDFIFFFKNNKEAEDIVYFLQSLSHDEILERSVRARNYVIKYYTPQIVWRNFYLNVCRILAK